MNVARKGQKNERGVKTRSEGKRVERKNGDEGWRQRGEDKG